MRLNKLLSTVATVAAFAFGAVLHGHRTARAVIWIRGFEIGMAT